MSLNQNTLVKLKQAGFRINNKWLVKDVSLQIEKGKIVTLIGPNGSGKSTTAKIHLGSYKKINGEACLLGEINDQIHNYDVVISCTGSQLPIIGLGMIERAIKTRKHKIFDQN